MTLLNSGRRRARQRENQGIMGAKSFRQIVGESEKSLCGADPSRLRSVLPKEP